MKRAYKLLNQENGSSYIPTKSSYYKTYSIKDTVDMGFVFESLRDAEKYGCSPFTAIWECECSHMEPIDKVVSSLAIIETGDVWLDRFWCGEKDYMATVPSPKGTLIGFDIILVKRIK